MGRLIDADRLKVMFEIEECPCALQAAILGIIDEQPTAYDLDKVIEQLEMYSNSDEAEQVGTVLVVELNDAIEIVKAGGVDAEH